MMKTRSLLVSACLFCLALAVAGCRPDEVECNCGGCCDSGGCDCITYPDLLERQKEAQTNLNAIFTSETAYFGEHSTYSPSFAEIGWGPEGQNYYAYFTDGDSVQSKVSEPFTLPGWVVPATSEFGFTIVAVSNIDCDLTLDIWSINDAKLLMNLSNDVNQ